MPSEPRLRRSLPRVVEAECSDRALADWVREHREIVDSDTRGRGALLFRGFRAPDDAALEELIEELYGGGMEYRDRAVPRSRVRGNLYTATDYSPNHTILLHNESS